MYTSILEINPTFHISKIWGIGNLTGLVYDSPLYPSMSSRGMLKKLPVTWDQVVVAAGYSGFPDHALTIG